MPEAYVEAVAAPYLEPPRFAKAIKPEPPDWVRNLPSVWSLDAQIEWLIEDLMPLGGITLLSAASGTGKTWVAHAIAGAVAHGLPFIGCDVQRRPVLYCDRENPLAVVKRNIEGLGIPRTDDLSIWGGWHTALAPGPDDQRLLEFANAYRPLLVWDSLVRFHTGDEQSAKETSAFMAHFRQLTNAGATVLVLHHTGKTGTSKEYRGSSDIEAAVDMAYLVEGTPREGALHRLMMRCFKSRYAPGRNFGLEFQPGHGFVPVEVAQEAQRASAEAVVPKIIAENPGLNRASIWERAKPLGVGRNKVYEYLDTLPSRAGKGREKLYHPPPEVPAA